MIKVILNGCNGRMGRVITDLIEKQNDMTVTAGIDIAPGDKTYPVYPNLRDCGEKADVLIDFSNPAILPQLISDIQKKRLPAVIATTGLSDSDLVLLEEASRVVPLFRSFNMSLGINLVQQLVQNASKILGDRFDVEIIEKHHNKKKDSPSGTALMLADSVNQVRTEKLEYVFGRSGNDALRRSNELGIHAFRGGTIVGEHEVVFTGTDEIIEVGHKAYSRQIFATGAIAAARFLTECRPGLYNMQDMLTHSRAVTTLYTYPDELLVTLNNVPNKMDIIKDLYKDFAQADIFIDMISQTGLSEDFLSISFTVQKEDLLKVKNILKQIRTLIPEIKSSIKEKYHENNGRRSRHGVPVRSRFQGILLPVPAEYRNFSSHHIRDKNILCHRRHQC